MLHRIGIFASSRSVVGGFDADAEIFFTAGSITDATEKNALNQRVLDLKGGAGSLTPNGTNFWDKAFLVDYPISPTSLAAAALNLRDPNELVNAFNIIWINSPSHASSGVSLSGANYGRTSIIPSTHLSLNNVTLSSYLGLTWQGNNQAVMGSFNSTSSQLVFRAGTTIQTRYYCHNNNAGQGLLQVTSGADGSLIASRRSPTDAEIYHKGVSQGSLATGGGSLPSVEIFFGGNNNLGSLQFGLSNELRAGSVMTGLTDNEAADLKDLDQRYQTNVISGGRQV